MATFLRTLHPCRDCGKAAQIRSRRDIAFATCPECRETRRLESLLGGYDVRRTTAATKADKAAAITDRAAGWFEAASAACEVARFAVLVAGRTAEIRKKRRLGRIAEGRRKWAASALQQLAALLGDERATWTGHLKLVPPDARGRAG